VRDSACVETNLAGVTTIYGVMMDITDRKQVLEALQKSEATLRAILDATPFPIALVDTQDDIIEFWSRSALALFGHTAPTAAEWYQLAYPDPDYRRAVIDRWKACLDKARLSAQTVNTGEYRVACRDGSVRICELYAGFLADRLIVTFNDITERKRAEEALHDSEKWLRAIFEQAAVGVAQAEIPGGRFVRVNQRFCDLLGYTEEEMQRLTFQALTPPEDLEADLRETARLKTDEISQFTLEKHLRKRDGALLWVNLTVSRLWLEGEQPRYHISIVQDITERKQAEEALAQEQSLMQALMDNLPNRIYFKDRASRFIKISQSQAHMFGLRDPAQAVGKTDFEFFTEEHARQAYQDGQGIIQSGRPLTKEEKETWADRPDTWVLTSKLPTRDKEGSILGILGLSRDITERKQAE
jgi:PAS domain S-box-containing protein